MCGGKFHSSSWARQRCPWGNHFLAFVGRSQPRSSTPCPTCTFLPRTGPPSLAADTFPASGSHAARPAQVGPMRCCATHAFVSTASGVSSLRSHVFQRAPGLWPAWQGLWFSGRRVWLFLLMCSPPRANHLPRSLPPSLAAPYAKETELAVSVLHPHVRLATTSLLARGRANPLERVFPGCPYGDLLRARGLVTDWSLGRCRVHPTCRQARRAQLSGSTGVAGVIDAASKRAGRVA